MQTPGSPPREAGLVPLGWEWETPTWGLWASWSVHPSLPLSSPPLLLRNVKWYFSDPVPGFQSLIWLCVSFIDGTYFREISSELLTASSILYQLIFSRCGEKGNMAKFCFLKGWANGPPQDAPPVMRPRLFHAYSSHSKSVSVHSDDGR